MFVYSLDGLKIEGGIPEDAEIEENDTTARSAVYHVLGRLFNVPDQDSRDAAVGGEWADRLVGAAALLAYPFDFGSASIPDTVDAGAFQTEYLRLFEVGPGTDGPGAPLYGGVYKTGDRMRQLEEVVRFYEYFGLTTSPEDPRPADHLATELEFMQYLAFLGGRILLTAAPGVLPSRPGRLPGTPAHPVAAGARLTDGGAAADAVLAVGRPDGVGLRRHRR